MPLDARPLRVQALQKRPSAGIRAKYRQCGETQHPCGIAPVTAPCPNAPVSPVTPEVAGSSPSLPLRIPSTYWLPPRPTTCRRKSHGHCGRLNRGTQLRPRGRPPTSPRHPPRRAALGSSCRPGTRMAPGQRCGERAFGDTVVAEPSGTELAVVTYPNANASEAMLLAGRPIDAAPRAPRDRARTAG